LAESWTLTPYRTLGHEELARRWQELEGRSSPSCFQSWAWVGTWLECLPAEVAPQIAVRRAGGAPASGSTGGSARGAITGLAVLCRAAVRRHRILPLTDWYLTETGRVDCDVLTVEHNAPLLAGPLEPTQASATSPPASAALSSTCGLMEWLHAQPGWDELIVPGLDASRLPEVTGFAQRAGLTIEEYYRKPWYWVDLADLRNRGTQYLDALSSNTRYQIRRARRAYEKSGPLTISVASSLQEARDYFAALEQLHQKYWIARGAPGAFSRPFFRKFHERYIETRFAAGNVQLARVAAGNEPIGYLYNLVAANAVYAYQSGFAYSDDPHLKPGVVTHAACVELNMAAGRCSYDFLAGRGQYKDSLSLAKEEMVWLRLQRPRLKLAMERQARSWVRRLRGAGAAPPAKKASRSG